MIAATSLAGKADPIPENASARTPRPTPIVAPLFVLAPPRSFTSVVCAMLGQHPQMYGLPETQLFTAETVAGVWKKHRADFWKHGLLRAVAQLYFGEQSEFTVKLARAWLRRRSPFNTGFIFESLAERVYPLIPVEKTPDVVFDPRSLERMHKFFPQARFLHLLRHPRGHAESNLRAVRRLAAHGQQPPPWIFSPEQGPSGATVSKRSHSSRVMDPQRGWYLHNTTILKFLESLPEQQKMRVRGEELLTDPDTGLCAIADWLGLRRDSVAIEQMKHPESSPYAVLGPPGARFGNSTVFIENPKLRSDRVKLQSLDGPLPWRTDGEGFLPSVKQLASEFGYN